MKSLTGSPAVSLIPTLSLPIILYEPRLVPHLHFLWPQYLPQLGGLPVWPSPRASPVGVAICVGKAPVIIVELRAYCADMERCLRDAAREAGQAIMEARGK